MSPPFRKAELRILWGSGFEPLSGLVDLLAEAGRLALSKGTIKVGDTAYPESEIGRAIAEHPELVEDWLLK